MSIKKLLKDISTGRDNQTFEVTRTFGVVVLLITMMVMCVGTGMEIWHAFTTQQFDLQSYFQAYAVFIPAIGTFLIMLSGSIRMKPENSQTALSQQAQTTPNASTGS